MKRSEYAYVYLQCNNFEYIGNCAYQNKAMEVTGGCGEWVGWAIGGWESVGVCGMGGRRDESGWEGDRRVGDLGVAWLRPRRI